MSEHQINCLREMLLRFVSASASGDAKRHARDVLSFLSSEPRPWSRAALAGHLTASAWVLDRNRTHAALIHHRKLNRWLQPGGHVESQDSSWRAAAQREVTEETGLADFIAQATDDDLFDVDVHPIPARADEPAHSHYDLRFLFVADTDAVGTPTLLINADEAHDCRWFSLATLGNDATIAPSMQRMIELSHVRTV